MTKLKKFKRNPQIKIETELLERLTHFAKTYPMMYLSGLLSDSGLYSEKRPDFIDENSIIINISESSSLYISGAVAEFLKSPEGLLANVSYGTYAVRAITNSDTYMSLDYEDVS